MSPDHDESDLQSRLDALADDLVRRGMNEGGDFFVSGHREVVDVSSEYVGLIRREGALRVFYSDMGRKRVLAETTDFETARAAFLDHALHLAAERGRGVDESGLRR